MERIKETFDAIIGSLAAEPQMSIGDLRLSTMSAEQRRERASFIRSAAAISEDF